ncbi:hypothetical protein ACHAWF_007871, partial [Thalassiosira exigua]
PPPPAASDPPPPGAYPRGPPPPRRLVDRPSPPRYAPPPPPHRLHRGHGHGHGHGPPLTPVHHPPARRPPGGAPQGQGRGTPPRLPPPHPHGRGRLHPPPGSRPLPHPPGRGLPPPPYAYPHAHHGYEAEYDPEPGREAEYPPPESGGGDHPPSASYSYDYYQGGGGGTTATTTSGGGGSDPYRPTSSNEENYHCGRRPCACGNCGRPVPPAGFPPSSSSRPRPPLRRPLRPVHEGAEGAGCPDGYYDATYDEVRDSYESHEDAAPPAYHAAAPPGYPAEKDYPPHRAHYEAQPAYPPPSAPSRGASPSQPVPGAVGSDGGGARIVGAGLPPGSALLLPPPPAVPLSAPISGGGPGEASRAGAAAGGPPPDGSAPPDGVRPGSDAAARADGAGGAVLCTCKKSKCLKLYCQCFASSVMCGVRCRCRDCLNTPEQEKARGQAVRKLLTRNPGERERRRCDSEREGEKGVAWALRVLPLALRSRRGEAARWIGAGSLSGFVEFRGCACACVRRGLRLSTREALSFYCAGIQPNVRMEWGLRLCGLCRCFAMAARKSQLSARP